MGSAHLHIKGRETQEMRLAALMYTGGTVKWIKWIKRRFNIIPEKKGLTFQRDYGIICFVVSESRRKHRGVEQPGSSSGS